MKKGLIRFFVLLLLVLFCCVLTGCDKMKKKGHEIKIGLIAMLTGENASNGKNMADAAKLAVDRINEQGGVKLEKRTCRVALLVEDEKGSPDGAMEAARKLIFQEGVHAIVGPQFSSSAIPVARLAESKKVLMIAPMSTHPDTTDGKKYVFRIPYIDTFQGMVLARFARERLHARSAAVLYDIAAPYNRTLAEIFMKTFEESGGEIVAYETYTTDQNLNFGEQLDRISERAPNVLFLPNYSSDVLIQVQQARERGIEATLMGGDGWDHWKFSGIAGFDDSYITRHWDPGIGSNEAREFTEMFTERYGKQPEDVAATTFDAFGLLFAAMCSAGKVDAESLQQAMYRMGPFKGVTGTIKYTDSGDPVKSALIIRIKDGSASVHSIVEP